MEALSFSWDVSVTALRAVGLAGRPSPILGLVLLRLVYFGAISAC